MSEKRRGEILDEDEISLIDILLFFRKNWIFLVVTTLGLSALTTIIFLSQPKKYQKKLALQIQPNPIKISPNLLPNLSIPQLDNNQAGQLAVTLLGNQKLDQITSQSRYDNVTQQVNITLKSTNSQALKDIVQRLLDQIKTSFQPEIQDNLEQSLDTVELELNKNQQILKQIERQIAQSSSEDKARLEALEEQRANIFVSNTALEFDQQYLEKVENDIPNFTRKVLSIEVLSQSEVEQTNSLLQLTILSLIASFMVAIVTGIIRSRISDIQTELAKREVKSNKSEQGAVEIN